MPISKRLKRNGLTPRQQRFVAAYLANDLNASEAARASGYKGKNADVIGPRMLGNAGIQKAITERLAKIIGSEEATIKRRVLVELQREAFDNQSTIIIKDSGGNEIYKQNNAKLKALELLAKYCGILTDKLEITGKDGAPIAYQVLPETARE